MRMVLLGGLFIFYICLGVRALYKALYRKYRPTTFDDVCGQEHITSILKYQCANSKHSHAYLFCGTRGTGKTSCAKILAKAINCLSPVDGNPCGKCSACLSIESGVSMDIVEMDAASNNGIDDIRDIRDEVVYTPSELKYKVYIIDEVHMLSINAFNGLLKTLEEPPSYVVFILATTEMHKLPTTIVSRCQRYDFRKLSGEIIVKRLSYIAEQEKLIIDEDAARLIARLASGGMRDAISLFELCAAANGNIDIALVTDILGVSNRETLRELVIALKNKDYAKIFEIVRDTENSSKDIAVFWQDLISFFRDMLVCKTLRDPASYLEMSENDIQGIKALVEDMSTMDIIRYSKQLDSALYVMQKSGSYKRNIAEMTLVRMCDSSLDTTPDSLISRINELEGRVIGLNAMIGENSNTAPKRDTEIKKQPPVLKESTEDKLLRETLNTEKEPEFKESVNNINKGTRTTIDYWDDVIEHVKKVVPTAKGFFENSCGYITEDKEYIISLGNDMAVKMMSREKTRNTVAQAISFYSGTRVSDAQLTFVSEPSEKKNKSPIDDLI